jgi:hypothetical protein
MSVYDKFIRIWKKALVQLNVHVPGGTKEVEFEILTAVIMQSSVFWDVTPIISTDLHSVMSQKIELCWN